MPEMLYRYAEEVSAWEESAGGWTVSRLCGMACTAGGQSREQGLFSLATLAGRFEASDLRPVSAQVGEEGLTLAWEVPAAGLRVESRWRFSLETGVWNRADQVRNVSGEAVVLTRALSRFTLAPGGYRLYSQGAIWSHENQGEWRTVPHGEITLGCVPGRTTEGGTPFLGVSDPAQQRGVAFHVLPVGNWTIRARTSLPPAALVLEMGMQEEDLRLTLEPGEALELPCILVHGLPQGEIHLATARLHQYLMGEVMPPARMTLPVVYNTWFDQWDNLEVERLRRQLAVAKEIGCEVFVIDAGWFGGDADNWSVSVGNWHEKRHSAFRGEMRAFGDEVRAAGLGFGIWMETERVCPKAPIAQDHPEWLVPGGGGCFRYDLENEEVYAYVRSEMGRLVEQYELDWMKIDFNFSLGEDPAGRELNGYFQAWYRLLEEVRAAYPGTFFEGCASGGMRLDLSTLARFDGHFLSDTVNPIDVLRISEGAWLRLPPGRLGKWAVLRGAEVGWPGYFPGIDVRVITPSSAVWDEAGSVLVDFACRVALVGQLGLSGDPESLPPEARERLAWHIAFYKEWREFVGGAAGHLLTPPRPITDRSGWAAVQLADPAGERSMLVAYRLEDTAGQETFRLRGLEGGRKYRVSDPDRPEAAETWTGEDLMRVGLTVELGDVHQAALRVVEGLQ